MSMATCSCACRVGSRLKADRAALKKARLVVVMPEEVPGRVVLGVGSAVLLSAGAEVVVGTGSLVLLRLLGLVTKTVSEAVGAA